MTEINFYHLTETSLEQALPELLQKTLAKGWRAVVMAGSEERVEALTQHLWTLRTDSFLPHGSKKDGRASDQPIWLTAEDERPNEAEVLFLTDGAVSAHLNDYVRACNVFNGNDDEAVQAGRALWVKWRDEGHTMTYWKQNENGGWSKGG